MTMDYWTGLYTGMYFGPFDEAKFPTCANFWQVHVKLGNKVMWSILIHRQHLDPIPLLALARCLPHSLIRSGLIPSPSPGPVNLFGRHFTRSK